MSLLVALVVKPAVITATTAYFIGLGPLGIAVSCLVWLFS